MPSTRSTGRTGTRGRATKVVANMLFGGGRKRASRKVNDKSSAVSENTNVEVSGKNVELIKTRKTTLADITDNFGDDPQAISVETAVRHHDVALDSVRKNVFGNEIDEEVHVEGERVNGVEAVPERGVSEVVGKEEVSVAMAKMIGDVVNANLERILDTRLGGKYHAQPPLAHTMTVGGGCQVSDLSSLSHSDMSKLSKEGKRVMD